MRIAIAHPPVHDFYATPHRTAGMGLELVQRAAARAGYETVLLNFCTGSLTQVPLPKSLNYLKPYLVPGERGPVKFFTAFNRIGPGYEEAALQVLRTKPDIIAMGLFAFAYAEDAAALCDCIKRLNPEIPIVLGGAGAAVHPDWFFNRTGAEYLFYGEAELGFTDFLTAFQNGTAHKASLPNLYRREISRWRSSRPQESQLRTGKAEIQPIAVQTGDRTLSAYISRGCRKRCSFCSNHLTQGREFRFPPLSQVLNETEKILQKMDHTHSVNLNIEDDNLLQEKPLLLKILRTLKQQYGNMTFSFENGIDYTMLDEATLNELIDLGVKQFNLSLGSLQPQTLNAINRPAHLRRYEKICATLSERKVHSITYFICGLKEDTAETIAETLIYLAKVPGQTGISLFYPVPGIAGYTDLKQFDSIQIKRCLGAAAWPWNGSLSTEEMVTAFRLARLSNGLKAGPQNDLESELFRRIFTEKQLYTLVRRKKRNTIIKVPDQNDQLAEKVISGLEGLRRE